MKHWRGSDFPRGCSDEGVHHREMGVCAPLRFSGCSRGVQNCSRIFFTVYRYSFRLRSNVVEVFPLKKIFCKGVYILFINDCGRCLINWRISNLRTWLLVGAVTDF